MTILSRVFDTESRPAKKTGRGGDGATGRRKGRGDEGTERRGDKTHGPPISPRHPVSHSPHLFLSPSPRPAVSPAPSFPVVQNLQSRVAPRCPHDAAAGVRGGAAHE